MIMKGRKTCVRATPTANQVNSRRTSPSPTRDSRPETAPPGASSSITPSERTTTLVSRGTSTTAIATDFHRPGTAASHAATG